MDGEREGSGGEKLEVVVVAATGWPERERAVAAVLVTEAERSWRRSEERSGGGGDGVVAATGWERRRESETER